MESSGKPPLFNINNITLENFVYETQLFTEYTTQYKKVFNMASWWRKSVGGHSRVL